MVIILKARNIQFFGDSMQIGDKVPDIEAEAFHNEEIKKIKFSDYTGKGKWLAIVFYPGDFTFVCPTELEELAELYEDFKKEGAEIMTVSTDSVYVHKAWHDTSESIKQIKFPMLADRSGLISRIFDTYVENDGVALRGSFIVDPDGVLKAMEINDLSIGRSAAELLRKLQAAKFVREHNGLVCPAKWKPGAKTLKPGLDLVGKL
jgi:NADH-dependent peroxiredoxin subunit C